MYERWIWLAWGGLIHEDDGGVSDQLHSNGQSLALLHWKSTHPRHTNLHQKGCHDIQKRKRKEKTTPFGIDLMRNLVLYLDLLNHVISWAAQRHDIHMQCKLASSTCLLREGTSDLATSFSKNAQGSFSVGIWCCWEFPNLVHQLSERWKHVSADIQHSQLYKHRHFTRQVQCE